MAAKGPTQAVCAAVDERDQYCCVRCGRFIDGGSRHHRQLRRFGDHSPANLILLCGSGTTGCHGWVHGNPRPSYESGWLVHGWQDPAETPVRIATRRGERWVLLDREGNRKAMSENEARERMTGLGVTS